MITPINGHVLIEPVKHQTYLPTEKGIYEEVGTVIGCSDELKSHTKILFGKDLGDGPSFYDTEAKIEIGDRVYFDAWLAGKYPTGKDDEFFWLVDFKDIKAVERAEPDTDNGV